MSLKNFKAQSKPFGHMVQQIQTFLEDLTQSRKTIYLDGYEKMLDSLKEWFLDHLGEECHVQMFDNLDQTNKRRYYVVLTKWAAYPVLRVHLYPSESVSVDFLEAFLEQQSKNGFFTPYVKDLSIVYNIELDRADDLLVFVSNLYQGFQQQNLIGEFKMEVFVPSRHRESVLQQTNASSVF